MINKNVVKLLFVLLGGGLIVGGYYLYTGVKQTSYQQQLTNEITELQKGSSFNN